VIGSLRGVILDRVARAGQAAEVLLEVGGVGYRVLVPSGSLGQVGLPGSPAFLHVHTHVREDAIVLYGFPSREERVCFEALIGAHGVGPAVALAEPGPPSGDGRRRSQVGDTGALPAAQQHHGAGPGPPTA
jgi:Holliday junction DNA helicase RuvA